MRPLHVLLVDDNLPDLMLAHEIFEAHAATVSAVSCRSGAEALAHLRDPARPRPDVMVLDVNMPGLSGFEVLQAMKDDPALRDIPVVMLSTSGDPRDVSLAYTLQASSYLVKAHEFRAFVEQIEAFVGYISQTRLPRWPAR